MLICYYFRMLYFLKQLFRIFSVRRKKTCFTTNSLYYLIQIKLQALIIIHIETWTLPNTETPTVDSNWIFRSALATWNIKIHVLSLQDVLGDHYEKTSNCMSVLGHGLFLTLYYTLSEKVYKWLNVGVCNLQSATQLPTSVTLPSH